MAASNNTMLNGNLSDDHLSSKDKPMSGNLFEVLGGDDNEVENLISSFAVEKKERKGKKGKKPLASSPAEDKPNDGADSESKPGVKQSNRSKTPDEGRNNGVKKHEEGRKDGEEEEGWKVIHRPCSSRSSSVSGNRNRDGYHYQPKPKAADKHRRSGSGRRGGDAVLPHHLRAKYDKAMLKLHQQRRARGEIANPPAAANPNPQIRASGNDVAKADEQCQRRESVPDQQRIDRRERYYYNNGNTNYQHPFNHQQQQRPDRYKAPLPWGDHDQRAAEDLPRVNRMRRRSNSGGHTNPDSKEDDAAAARAGAHEERFKKWQEREKQRQLEAKLMTLKVYEENLQEERKKAIESNKKPQEQAIRVVTPDKDFESMRLLHKNKQDEDCCLHNSDKVEKKKKSKALVPTNFSYPEINYPEFRRGGKEREFRSEKPAANGSKKE